jgi:hypothetical protein
LIHEKILINFEEHRRKYLSKNIKSAYALAVVTPAVPCIPGSPFLAIPANNFLISAMARPGFNPWNAD